MKKCLIRIICLLAMLSVLFASFAGCTTGQGASQKETTVDSKGTGTTQTTAAETTKEEFPAVSWKMQSTEVAGTPRYGTNEYFVNMVKEKTNGKFNIELYPAAALYPVANTLDAVKQNVTQAGLTSSDYHAGAEPMLNLQVYRASDNWSLPGAIDVEMDEAFLAAYEPLLEKAYSNLGVQYVSLLLHAPTEIFHSNKKIEKLEDFKGMKVRTSGLGQQLFTALGAAVVSMPMGEVYTAAQLNTIDGFEVGCFSDNWANALYEVSKYVIIPPPHQGSPGIASAMLVNNKEWEKLPENYKQILRECARATRDYSIEYIQKMDKEAIQKFKDYGIEIIELPDEMVKEIRRIAAGTMKQYWGKSQLTDEFLNVYIKFLREHNLGYIAEQIEK